MSGHPAFEYRVVPAPRQAPRIRGLRRAADRFAIAMADVLNEAGREGWEYLRTDTLPMETPTGIFGGRTVAPQELLVFRRAMAEGDREGRAREGAEAPWPQVNEAPRRRLPEPRAALRPSAHATPAPQPRPHDLEALRGAASPFGPVAARAAVTALAPRPAAEAWREEAPPPEAHTQDARPDAQPVAVRAEVEEVSRIAPRVPSEPPISLSRPGPQTLSRSGPMALDEPHAGRAEAPGPGDPGGKGPSRPRLGGARRD